MDEIAVYTAVFLVLLCSATEGKFSFSKIRESGHILISRMLESFTKLWNISFEHHFKVNLNYNNLKMNGSR